MAAERKQKSRGLRTKYLGRPSKISQDEEYEFDTFIRSLEISSDRVRHVVIISIVASVLVFAAYRRTDLTGWWNSRISIAHTLQGAKFLDEVKGSQAVNNLFGGKVPTGSAEIEKVLDSCQRRILPAERCAQIEAYFWSQIKGHTSSSFASYSDELERKNVSEVLWVEVPFLGIRFDVNDLGTFSAIGLSIIAITLLYSMVRHHENLYLCLWKVRRVAEAENRYDDGQSKANFFYHAMAMTQVFSRPPTLARWGGRWRGKLVPIVLFVIPLLVQGLVFRNDILTERTGTLYSAELVAGTQKLHLLFGAILLITTILTIVFSFASEVRWHNTFFEINPGYLNIKPIGYLNWSFPKKHRKFRFVRQEGGRDGVQLILVDLSKKLRWVIPDFANQKEICDVPVKNRNPLYSLVWAKNKEESGDFLKDWHFNPLVQDDGCLYQVKGVFDGMVEISRCLDEDELIPGLWTVRRGAVLEGSKPCVLVEVVGERILRLEHGSHHRLVCSVKEDGSSVASSQRGILDIAVASLKSGEELILVADLMSGRLKKVTGNRFELVKIEEGDSGQWVAVAVICHLNRLYVAEKKRRLISRVFGISIRVRVINLEELTKIPGGIHPAGGSCKLVYPWWSYLTQL